MIVQIYSVTSVADALSLAALGVDHIGFVAGVYGEVKSEFPFDQARAIADALRGRAKASALTMSTDPAEILRMAEAVRPDIVHISTDTDAVGVPALRQLREALSPEIQLMKAIHVDGPESIAAARAFAPASDILLLDTKFVGLPGVGATGRTHDWKISRQIIEQVGNLASVILAGGLTPENVAMAIHATCPWGVDSFTGTNYPGSGRKDLSLVRQFVERAMLAE
ncbi:MAG: phosphoribosylanthranilate isomerase [Thermomicrobiales bacterium]